MGFFVFFLKTYLLPTNITFSALYTTVYLNHVTFLYRTRWTEVPYHR